MAFDYKKEYKEFYLPKDKPSFVTVPPMNYLAVRGKGDPNAASGEYKDVIGLLYGIAFTIKMSKKGSRQIEGYFDYVVPPLEGFWWQEGVTGVDYTHKENFESHIVADLQATGQSDYYRRLKVYRLVSAAQAPWSATCRKPPQTFERLVVCHRPRCESKHRLPSLPERVRSRPERTSYRRR